MRKLYKRLVAAIMLLVAALTAAPTTASADVELLAKDKTNKLVLGDNMDECLKGIEESLAAGKSVTYKISVAKGVLYIRIADFVDFKVEIYDSENKLVKQLDSVRYELYGDITLASGSVNLSKGKYKIKISPKDKKSELNLAGIVAMLKTSTSATISLNKKYNFAVQKGKTYKYKLTVEDANAYGVLSYQNLIQSYDPKEFLPHIQDLEIFNSKGKRIARHDMFNSERLLTLKNGTYTIEFEADKTGILAVEVSFVNLENQ